MSLTAQVPNFAVPTASNMDDYFDEYDHYNFDQDFDKMCGAMKAHSKSKQKERKHEHKFSPSGNVRKVVENIQNAEKKAKRQRLNSV